MNLVDLGKHLNSPDDKARIMEKASGDLLIFCKDISREHAKSKPSDMPHLLVQLRPQIVSMLSMLHHGFLSE